MTDGHDKQTNRRMDRHLARAHAQSALCIASRSKNWQLYQSHTHYHIQPTRRCPDPNRPTRRSTDCVTTATTEIILVQSRAMLSCITAHHFVRHRDSNPRPLDPSPVTLIGHPSPGVLVITGACQDHNATLISTL